MLNRHLLRAKALQYLYALQNSKRSNLLLAEDYLDLSFSPNFHTSEEITPATFERKKKLAKAMLQLILDGKDFPSDAESDIINHVRRAKKDYQEACKKDTEKYGQLMMEETLAVYDRFLLVMCFIRELGELCHQKCELTGVVAEEKKERLDYFYKAFPVESLRQSKKMSDLFIRNKIGWQEHREFIEDFYKTHFRHSDVTRKMLAHTPPDREAQQVWVEHVIKDLFFSSPATDSFFEDLDSNWGENKAIVKNMVYKTLKRIYESKDGNWSPVTITPDWEEDHSFFVKIYKNTTEESDKLDVLLEKYLQNWDLDRVTVVDTIILKMALTEMVHFPSIPVKVTINEYIELAKKYSTPKSKEFVNGILDRTSKDLKEDGTIKKSGRGLLDNN